MDIKELRIGNIVSEQVLGICEVEGMISKMCVKLKKENQNYVYHIDLDNISPIELTEEVLSKCGFVKDNYGVFEKVKNDAPYKSGCEILLWCKKCIVDNKQVWNFCNGKELDKLNELCNINYLHQLMNLFYALTNEELKYQQ